jgi:hypothetical protein
VSIITNSVFQKGSLQIRCIDGYNNFTTAVIIRNVKRHNKGHLASFVDNKIENDGIFLFHANVTGGSTWIIVRIKHFSRANRSACITTGRSGTGCAKVIAAGWNCVANLGCKSTIRRGGRLSQTVAVWKSGDWLKKVSFPAFAHNVSDVAQICDVLRVRRLFRNLVLYTLSGTVLAFLAGDWFVGAKIADVTPRATYASSTLCARLPIHDPFQAFIKETATLLARTNVR